MSALRRMALAACAVLALPAAADAEVTQSKVTSFGATPFAFYDEDAPGAGSNTVTLTGTTNGQPGDTVRLHCGAPGLLGSERGEFVVGAGGAVSAPVSLSAMEHRACRMRLLPDPTPLDISAFEPLDVYAGVRRSDRYDSGPLAGQTQDFFVAQPQPSGYADYRSLAAGGLYDMTIRVAGADSLELFYENGSLGRYYQAPSSGDLSPHAIIDGGPAYGPAALPGINAAAGGLVALSYTHALDPATGDLVLTETDPLVTCPAFPPSNAVCPSFSPTGVTIDRSIRQDHGGRMVRIVDTIRSTDGATHSYRLDYAQWLNGNGTDAGYRFPGETAFSPRLADDVVDGPAAASATTYFRRSSSGPADPLENPYGAQTVAPAPELARFLDPNGFVQRFEGELAASGSVTVTQVFSMGATEAAVVALAGEALDPVDPVDPPVDPGPGPGPVPGPTADPPQPAAPAPPALPEGAGLATVQRVGRAVVRRRRGRLVATTGDALVCATGGPVCAANVVLSARRRKARRTTLGLAAVTVAAGESAKVAVTLSRKGARLLRRGRAVKARAAYTLRAADGSTRTHSTSMRLQAPS